MSTNREPTPSAENVHLGQALALHQAGRIGQAKAIYEQLLKTQPHSADVLRLLGTAECQLGNLTEGIRYLGESLAVSPNQPATHNNRGVALSSLGRLDEALISFGKALAIKPDFAEAHNNRGNALRDLGRLHEALESYDQALALKRDYAEAHSNRGGVLKHLERFDEALASYDKAIAIKPNDAGAYNNRGVALTVLMRLDEAMLSFDKAVAIRPDYGEAYCNRAVALRDLERLEEALTSCDKALAIKPAHAEAHYNRGDILRDLKRLAEALGSYDKALAIKPDLAEAHNNRGVVLKDLTRHEEALESFGKALAIKPDHVEAHVNRGLALSNLNRPRAALESYDKALALDPGNADAYVNQGATLYGLGRPEEAVACYDRAIHLNPGFAAAYWNKSLAKLLIGEFADGWALHEWRWRGSSMKDCLRQFAEPLWLGEQPIDGKTILIYHEQGLGDVIQFCRYLPMVEKLGAKIILEVPSPLVSLMSSLKCDCVIVEAGKPLPRFDVRCPIMSLPLAFKTTLDSIPADVPYLFAEPRKSDHWRSRLGSTRLLRVGLVWAGGFRPNQPEVWGLDARRNMPLAKVELLDCPNVQFFSLQKGERAEGELRELQDGRWHGPKIIDYTSELKDFSDTAALIDNLDLVISVDTSTAHLAAAMGKPTWILNRFDTCWRWLLDRTDSPWYPSVTLFRQSSYNDWTNVVAEIRAKLSMVQGPSMLSASASLF